MSAIAPDWYERNLVIKHRTSGKYVPFKANPIQKRLRAIVQKQKRERGYIRIIILKARQEGVSTEVQAEGFRMALSVPGVEGLVVANETDAADAVFRRTQIFEERCPIRLPKKYSNRKEIEWGSPHYSAIRVTVAGEDAGRADTRHFLHLTEVGFWKDAHQNSAIDGLLNSVHDVPGTFIALESTANGCAGVFYDMWNAAVNGENGYEPVFFSWLDDPEYQLPGMTPDDPMFANVPREWRAEEEALRASGATEAQLAWRLQRIATKCKGQLDKFDQEYPTTPRHAFISSGAPRFPRSIVEANRIRAEKEEKQNPARKMTVVFRRDHTREQPPWEIREDSAGLLRVWQLPDRYSQYLLSGDVARGVTIDSVEGDGQKLGDYSTCGVFDRTSKREVAVWHGRVDPDLFGLICDAIGRWYNNALAVVEANGLYGVPAIRAMLRASYPNMYRRRRHDRPTSQPVDVGDHGNYMEYGWWSNEEAKAVAIFDLNALLRDRALWTPEPEAWAEMLTFERKKDGKMGARRGCYDDRVMRVAIAATILTAHPLPSARPVTEAPQNSPAGLEAIIKQRAEMSGRTPGGLQL